MRQGYDAGPLSPNRRDPRAPATGLPEMTAPTYPLSSPCIFGQIAEETHYR